MCPSRNWLSLGMRSFTPPFTSLARGRQMLTTDMEATVGMASWPPLLPLWTLVLLGQDLLSPLTLLMPRRLLILQLLMVPILSRELLLLASGRLMPTMVMEAMVLLSQRLNPLTLASLLLRALELLCLTSLLSRKRLPPRDQPTLLICPSRSWLLLGMK